MLVVPRFFVEPWYHRIVVSKPPKSGYAVLSLIVMVWRMVYILNVVGVKVQNTLKSTLFIFSQTAFFLLLPGIAVLLHLSTLRIIISAVVSALVYLFFNYKKFHREGYV